MNPNLSFFRLFQKIVGEKYIIVHCTTEYRDCRELAVTCTIRYSFTIFSPSQTPNGQTCIAEINSGEDKKIRLPGSEIYSSNELM